MPNASCTLYLQQAPGVYARRFVAACFWQEQEDGTTHIGFEQQTPPLPEPYAGRGKERDYIARGECTLEVTDTATLRALLETGAARTLDAFLRYDYGGLAHYEVIAT